MAFANACTTHCNIALNYCTCGKCNFHIAALKAPLAASRFISAALPLPLKYMYTCCMMAQQQNADSCYSCLIKEQSATMRTYPNQNIVTNEINSRQDTSVPEYDAKLDNCSNCSDYA
nr:hypothetical protein Iba_chr04aCG5050 [Ipomoea batatas]